MLGFLSGINADLICFPELAFTGYFFLSRKEIESYAFEFQSDFIQEFQKIATNSNKIIIVGFPEKFQDKIFNSAAILFPEQTLSRVYRKTHLFYKERFVFDAGNTGFFVVHEKERDLRLGSMICYDWRFPEASRTLALMGADLIVCPSNLVTNVWHISMPSRALENKVYFLVANRIGTEFNSGESLFFNGKSGIWDYNGKPLAIASETQEEIITAEIFPSETRKNYFNYFNKFFND
jgi:predicted amidohydrolase